jgi:RNA polymerase sigma-70 factor, ECF subfamily
MGIQRRAKDFAAERPVGLKATYKLAPGVSAMSANVTMTTGSGMEILAGAACSSLADAKEELLGSVPQLRTYAVSLCGSPEQADDMVQETFVRALVNIGSFEPGTNMTAWLSTILRNLFYSDYRKRRREVEDDEGYHAGLLQSPPTQEAHADLVQLGYALDLLAPDHREALILVGASGLSYDDAAARCGCAVGTMKSRVSRARGRLAGLLGNKRADLTSGILAEQRSSQSMHGRGVVEAPH